MPIERVYLACGTWWSSPFCRWQGSLAQQHALRLLAKTGRRVLDARGVAPDALDGIVLGMSVPQAHSFYGAPWVAGMMGLDGLTGPTVSQACATSVRVIATAALEVEAGLREGVLAVACDRTSNGPHVYYPDPTGPGGRGSHEDPVWDSFSFDPHALGSMAATAEAVALGEGITREEQDAMALLRDAQYREALADDRAFQRRYMVDVEVGEGRRLKVVSGDEGVHPTTTEGLARLDPVQPGGTLTYGNQTHPADGNAGMLVCSRSGAAALAAPGSPVVQVLGWGQARVDKGLMPMATVPAARDALFRAGVRLDQVDAFKTHNPFAVNDVYFCRALGLDPQRVNRFGSPLVYGHPQAPMGLRAVIELCEELVGRGGGVGLFAGCAAGDSAMALVVRVSG